MRADPRAITPQRPEPLPVAPHAAAPTPLISFVRGCDHERLCADRGRREPDPSDAAPPQTPGLPELGQTLGPACSSIFVRTATKKQGGSSNNGRDSNPKFLGIKKYGGEHVIPGNIIARQRGTKWHCGVNCGIGVDHTVYALISGRVHFTDAKNPHKRGKKVINVVPHEQWPEVLAAAQAKNAAKRAKKQVR